MKECKLIEAMNNRKMQSRREPNAASARLKTREPGSNVKFEKFLQPSKQQPGMDFTDEGIQIDRSDEQHEKAPLPRVDSLERGSKATYERVLHRPQKAAEIVSIDDGIQIHRTSRRPDWQEEGPELRMVNGIGRPSAQTALRGHSCRFGCK
jgi:hypothetical protein